MAVDRVWLGIKKAANLNARRRHRLTRSESERIVRDLCSAEAKISLPRDAIEYFARELMRLTEEAARD
jgi:hypothetical protein